MRLPTTTPLALGAALVAWVAAAAASAPLGAPPGPDANTPRIYVPYKDIPSVLEPADRAVLMDRAAFETLLALADLRRGADDQRQIAQITRASYRGEVRSDAMHLSGTLTVTSLSDEPVAVPLRFAQVGLSAVTLDGKPAPLGYDRQGRLVLIVTGRGRHTLTVAGSTLLKELTGGGIQFGMSIPPAVAGEMSFQAVGDLEVHATVPVSSSKYDKQADRTDVSLALGGHDAVTVVLMGNGRQEDQRAILLGAAATTVQLTSASQTLNCLYTVQVLRRGVRDLTFDLPAGWTVTDVSCPALVRWSIAAPAKPGEPQQLNIRLRTASRGTKALHIQASAARTAQAAWTSPFIHLQGVDFEQGYLLVDTGRELAVRGQQLHLARREDLARASLVSGLLATGQGRLFYHWADGWSAKLDLAPIELRRSCEVRQRFIISPEELSLAAEFAVTAIGRELFDIDLTLPAEAAQWSIQAVTVNGSDQGFQYHVAEAGQARRLKIALAAPIRPEGVANVAVAMRHVPAGWSWQVETREREVALPLLDVDAETVSGQVAISPAGDLDVAAAATPKGLEAVPVGRMAAMGLAGDVQLAYTYQSPPAAPLPTTVSRRTARLAAEAVGLVSATSTKLSGAWRITYDISRAQAKTLYLLADKSLGQTITITAQGAQLANKNIVAPSKATVELSSFLAKTYDLWELTLDSPMAGAVIVEVRYDRPAVGSDIAVPLIRPIGAAQVGEMLAIQAAEELAVIVTAKAATDMDTIDLPPLPQAASRLLRAFRLEAPTTDAGAVASVALAAKVHEKYAIPAALAAEAYLTTHLGPRGGQQTQATFRVVNAGLQFLAIRLPKEAQLWSVKVGGQVAKPKREASGDYLVALGRSSDVQEVKVLYALPDVPGGLERLALARAALPDVKLNKLIWKVVPPPGWQVSRQFTDMEAHQPFRPKLAGQSILDGLQGLFRAVGAKFSAAGGVMAKRAASGVEYDRSAPQGAVVPQGGERWELAETEEAAQRPRRGGRAHDDPGLVDFGLAMRTKAPARTVPPPATQPAWRRPEDTPPPPQDAAVQTDERKSSVSGLVAAGRYTLPIEMASVVYSGPGASFSALGESDLEIGLVSRTDLQTTEWLGLAAVVLAGLLLIGRPAGAKFTLIALLLAASTLAAIWLPDAAYAANGVFLGALCLIPLYVVVGCWRWLWSKLSRRLPKPAPSAAAAAAAVLAVLAMLSAASSASAAGKSDEAPQGKPSAAPTAAVAPSPGPAPVPPPDRPAALVVPYEGDPTQADKSDKILVPYRRFVELWNVAHPNEKIDVPRGPVETSLADVRYAAALAGDRLSLTLTARVKTFGKGWTILPLPLEGVAVTSAELDGKPARLQMGTGGMILTLPGEAEGLLKVSAVTTAKLQGPRGSVELTLPPLPGAVMTVDLPEADLELEAPGIEGVPARQDGPGGKGVRWTVPLGAQRKLTLKWSPKVGVGAADRTLSAAVAHDVFAFHWAIVGVSKITYSFSAGQNDRFGLLLPEGVTLTDLTGANLRDFRETGPVTADGVKLRAIEVRLHRPAAKSHELTARWVGKLPALDTPAQLSLPRAAEVGRESGTVILHASGGVAVKVVDVVGGRRSDAAPAGKSRAAPATAEGQTEVARYYWPYRPFSLTVQLSRFAAVPKAHLDQLIRIDRRQVQLLAQVNLRTERGEIFGASFALPEGYELLSAVGPLVEDHYEQKTPAGRRLHVNFRGGSASTTVALVLLRKDADVAALAVPVITVLDAAGAELADQTGRLAVQVAASLDAQTAASENLRPINPRALAGWLADDQLRAVQFAYSYEKSRIALGLKVAPQPTKVRVEVFGGLTVQPTSAWYSYRLRYQIEGTPIDQVHFTLPGRYAPLVAVSSPALRGVAKKDLAGPEAGRTEWTISLVHEVTGTLDVTVNFALPIDPSITGLDIPRVATAAPEGYRAVLAVQNASRHKLRLLDIKRLEPMPQSEQAFLLSESLRRNLQFVLQSFTDDWSAQLGVEPAAPAARIEALVDLMALTTVIDPAGRARYEAALTLQNRTHQFLRVRVPEGLNLWSATVAGQPVKPVTDAKAGAGIVLIPLVKTSPGGLPYEVKLYLAGRAGQALGLVTELRPPSIRIDGMPVERTTWSLRLPAGYRYLRPGGNLSPILSAEEIEVVKGEVRLKQAKRLLSTAEELWSFGSDRGKQVAAYNIASFNKDISEGNVKAKQDLESNRRNLSGQEYGKLKQRLEDQSREQVSMLNVWNRRQQEAVQSAGDNNVNWFVNNDAVNGGVAEVVRNGYLNAMPTFVRQAAEGQKEQINKEIASNEALMNAPDSQAGKGGKTGAAKLTLSDGKELTVTGTLDLDGQQILVADADGEAKAAQMAQMLKGIQDEHRRYQKQRQDELQGQLSLTADNRLERYYALQGQAQMPGQGQGQFGHAQQANQPLNVNGTAGTLQVTGGTVRLGGASTFTGAGGILANGDRLRTLQPPGPQVAADAGRGRGGSSGSSGTGQTAGHLVAGGAAIHAFDSVDAFRGNGIVAHGDRAGAGLGEGGGVMAGDQLAIARGTYSLPIELPEGGVQWHFQGLRGEPEVSLLAVDERLIDGAHSTAAVLVILLTVWLLGLLVQQLCRRSELVGGFVVGYLLLAAVLAGLFASAGVGLVAAIVLFGAIVVPIELIHRLLVRRMAR